jgi:hypothetical protein
MLKTIAAIIGAAAFVMVAIALAPNVPTALATAPSVAENDGANLNQPATRQSCAVFEVWFLNPACSKIHVKKAARAKHHLARSAR